MGNRIAKDRELALEKKLAYATAKADISSFCEERGINGEQWFDISRFDGSDVESIAEFVKASVSEAVEYLTLIGKLQRHPKKPNLVQVL